MDSRAKQRLTGAVILVALFVLLVPELLTGPHEGTAPANAPAEEGLRNYTIDLDAPANAAQPMSTAPEPAVALPPVAANPMAESLPGNAGGAPQSAPEAVTPMSAVAQDAAPALPPPNATAPASASSAPASTVSSRPAAATPKPERGSFAVQLGSFGTKDNADRLVRDMTAKGFNAFIAPITSGGRELYRVRVGPARDRASAEALAAELRRIGQTGSIVPIS
jgi:DedD protein